MGNTTSHFLSQTKIVNISNVSHCKVHYVNIRVPILLHLMIYSSLYYSYYYWVCFWANNKTLECYWFFRIGIGNGDGRGGRLLQCPGQDIRPPAQPDVSIWINFLKLFKTLHAICVRNLNLVETQHSKFSLQQTTREYWFISLYWKIR